MSSSSSCSHWCFGNPFIIVASFQGTITSTPSPRLHRRSWGSTSRIQMVPGALGNGIPLVWGTRPASKCGPVLPLPYLVTIPDFTDSGTTLGIEQYIITTTLRIEQYLSPEGLISGVAPESVKLSIVHHFYKYIFSTQVSTAGWRVFVRQHLGRPGPWI